MVSLPLDQLDLPTFVTLRGYRRQVDLLRALQAAGTPVPQPVLSRMYRGEVVYPRARSRLAAFLDLQVDELDGLVERAA